VGLLSITPASAAIIIQNFTVPSTANLPVNTGFLLSGFNPALGLLTGIRIDLSVALESDYGFENLSGLADMVTSTITSTATLRLPNNTPLHTVAARIERGESVAGFDGNRDFAGASGRTYLDETASENSSVTLNDGASFAFFSSNGSLNLPFDIVASSTFTGASIMGYSLNTSGGHRDGHLRIHRAHLRGGRGSGAGLADHDRPRRRVRRAPARPPRGAGCQLGGKRPAARVLDVPSGGNMMPEAK